MKGSWRLSVVVFVVIVLVTSILPVSVLAQGPVGRYDEADFRRIAEDGLGDPMNNYAWSMAEFRGDVYVGTARNFLYAFGLSLKQAGIIPPDLELPFITRPTGDVATQQWAEDMRGEIWRYHQGEWTRVFQSNVTEVFPGTWTPDEPGFRTMATFADNGVKRRFILRLAEGIYQNTYC